MKKNEPQFNIPSLLRLGSLCLLAISLSCNKSPKDTDLVFKAPVSDTGTTPPSAVSGFSVVAGGSTQINLSWAAATDDLTPTSAIIYEICQSSATGGCDTFSISYTTAAGATNYAVGGLNSIQTYFFRVRARDAAGNRGGSSNEGSATTNPAGTVNTPTFSPVAGSYNPNQPIVISSSTPGAKICYRTDASSPTCDAAANCGAGDTTYSTSIPMAAANTTLTIKAIGCRVGYVNSAQATGAFIHDTNLPGNVLNFSAFNAGATQINLTWTNPGTDYAGTLIVRKLGSAPTSTTDGTQIFSAAGTGFGDTGLTTGTTYYYAAYAYDAAGNYAPLSGQTAFATPNTDITAPTVVSSTPDNAATNIPVCTGSPCRAKIILRFSESMNTGLGQTLTMEIHDGTSFVTAPASNVSFSWSTTAFTNDTLTIDLTVSWVWFPENSQIRYTLNTSGLQDLASNVGATQIRTFTTTAAVQNYPAADTGVTSCYDNSTAITCGNASWPDQDGDYVDSPVARSFSGPIQHGTYASDYTTTENVTGLVWKTCSEGQSGATCATGSATTTTWINAVNQCSALNLANSGNGYAGIKSWRLPTGKDFPTIIKFGLSNPAIDATYFPNSVSGVYWTSTPTYASQSNALGGDLFLGGRLLGSAKTSTLIKVRCVSGEPSATTKTLTDNGDGTITDSITNLRWQKCSNGKSGAACSGAATLDNWQNSLLYCNSLILGTFGNSSNWRLPSINEYLSLVNRTASNTLPTTPFPAGSGNYWTSTVGAAGSSAHDFRATDGGTDGNQSKSNSQSTRCVATGP